jgi:hypothetical protein
MPYDLVRNPIENWYGEAIDLLKWLERCRQISAAPLHNLHFFDEKVRN